MSIGPATARGGHIDLPHNGPSGRYRQCGHNDDTFPSDGGAALCQDFRCVCVRHMVQLSVGKKFRGVLHECR